ncbi:MAG: hypothetical protein ACTSXU_00160 [Promethearchaeota archaeon]
MSARNTRFLPTRINFRKLSKQSWLLIFVGIPLFIMLISIIIGYQVPNGLVMLLTALGLYLTTLKAKNFGIRFTRATFVGLITCFFSIGALVENPSLWPQQIYRHVFKNSMIQPNNSRIAEVEDAFNWWLDNQSTNFYNDVSFYGDNLTDLSKPLEDEYYNYNGSWIHAENLSKESFFSLGVFTTFEKLEIIDFFIRRFIMRWTDDEVTHHLSDHIPVPSEALSRWTFSDEWKADPTNSTLRAWDDCDGIAVVTVSFIRRLQLEEKLDISAVFIASGHRHWFTAVKINDSTPFVFLNHWSSIGVYCIYMDNNLPLYGQNILSSIENVLVTDAGDVEDFKFYLGFLVGSNFWLLIIVSFCIAAISTIFFGYPRNYDVEGEKLYMKSRMAKHAKKSRLIKPLYWLRYKIGNPFSKKHVFNKRHMFFWLNTIVMSLLLIAGVAFFYYSIILTPLFPYAMMVIYLYIFTLLVILDRDLVARSFKFIYKKVKKKDFVIYEVRA